MFSECCLGCCLDFFNWEQFWCWQFFGKGDYVGVIGYLQDVVYWIGGGFRNKFRKMISYN